MSFVLSSGFHACRTATLFLPHSPGNMTDIASQVGPAKPACALLQQSRTSEHGSCACTWPVTLHSRRLVSPFSRLPMCATAGSQRLPAGQCGGPAGRQREPRPDCTDDALSDGACSRSDPAYIKQWPAWCIQSFAVVGRERHTGVYAPSSGCVLP